jgi:hypothetical protein
VVALDGVVPANRLATKFDRLREATTVRARSLREAFRAGITPAGHTVPEGVSFRDGFAPLVN